MAYFDELWEEDNSTLARLTTAGMVSEGSSAAQRTVAAAVLQARALEASIEAAKASREAASASRSTARWTRWLTVATALLALATVAFSLGSYLTQKEAGRAAKRQACIDKVQTSLGIAQYVASSGTPDEAYQALMVKAAKDMDAGLERCGG